ncbi:MAG: TlpA family protein disulfide reductase [Gemmatimonadetes bacterium]|nr:TlpA family protein disulfide reductase [Gemmatimonadota bacterium]MYD13747.1 TlpA family protein disulfide reductase [Gemmatimonadota bacterium]MYI65705.1 TlpA family protein disulfide reductase [Gemmatimonadota bacterium]
MVRYRWSTLACVGVALAVLPVLSCTRESGLRFSTERPGAGSEITVSYVASSTLADESELVLRGTYRTAAGAVELLTIPNMQPGSGNTFTTLFTLPESAVYAAFVVEDPAGQRLDANGGRLFDLLVHGTDGSPLYRGLIARADEFEDRNLYTSLEAFRRAMELYPDSLDGWGRLRSLERRALGSSNGDSLFVWHQENFAGIDQRYRDREDLSASTVQAISDYATAVLNSEGASYWRAISEATVGTDDWALDITFSLDHQRRAEGPAGVLEEFERHWPDAQGRIAPFAPLALEAAIESSDLAAVDRWTERAYDGFTGIYLARTVVEVPERRDRALEIAREKYERSPIRPLGRTVDEHDQSVALGRATLLKDYARFLSEYASADEAIGIIEEATDQSASPDLFEALAELKLDQGDVDGAARAYAVVATDPGTPQPRADSLATLVGYTPDSPEWGAILEAARAQVRALVLSAAVDWTPAASHVTDATGERQALADLTSGKPTVLVFWARWCGPCIEKIPDVARLQETLEPLGAQVLSIAWRDPPGPDMDAFIEEHGITYPVYHDLVDDVTGAFGVFAIQTNFVLDAQGRLRFERPELVDIPRQVEALVR